MLRSWRRNSTTSKGYFVSYHNDHKAGNLSNIMLFKYYCNKNIGVIYSVKMKSDNLDKEILEEDTMEAIAKYCAIVKDSWDFYRMICYLLRNQ